MPLLRRYDPVFKVNPPLRTDADVAAVQGRAGRRHGRRDRHRSRPARAGGQGGPFDQAPPGMLGLETALALALTELDLPIERRAGPAVWQPAAIAGLDGRHGGPIAAGGPANLCVIDPAAEWTVDPARLASRSRNTPYAGRKLRGRVRHTILQGDPVVIDGEAQQ